MRKMPTLFVRKFENHSVVACENKITPGCEWVFEDESYATEKIDGTCCLIKDGNIYRRYDFKPGRTLPEGAIPCQEKADPVTGHFPHWLLCSDERPEDKYHLAVFRERSDWEDGTYELIGIHFQSNPYNLESDMLIKHGEIILPDVPKTYEGIKDYLSKHYIEGIVFYGADGKMCKIKRRDFGFKWNDGRKEFAGEIPSVLIRQE